MSKEQQKKYLKEIMEADEKDGLYMGKTPEEYEELINRIEAHNKIVIDKFVEEKVKKLEERKVKYLYMADNMDSEFDPETWAYYRGKIQSIEEAINTLKK